MERLIAALTAMAGNIPALAWIGYVHLSRPSRKECELKHEGVCNKLDMIIKKQDEMNGIILKHVINGSSK
jgi:hypothetical protein